MKCYNYISIFLFVSLMTLVSCTQDENLDRDGNSTQSFQILVSDAGFKTDITTRATENGYSTKFVNGDAIGIFAVRNGEIVSNINNVRCAMQNGSWEMETNIEYKESEFNAMSFYAYYPYNAEFNSDTDFDASQTLTDNDPFVNYVKNWKIEAQQGEANYTKYDLMTSVGKASGQRLKGEVSFIMQHRMALAVLQMPDKVYKFTNTDVTINDYTLPTQAGTFTLNNEKAEPYEQVIDSKTCYRFLINPDKEFTIEGTYIDGKDETKYDHTATLTSGQAKLYKVKNPAPVQQLLSVGDYFCADGSIVTKDVESAPENTIGIVFYVGNPQPSVTHPTTYTIEKDPLRRDFENCTHGLILAIDNAYAEDAETNRFGGAKKYYSDWFKNDDNYKDSYVNPERGKNIASVPGFQGYNNTVLMQRGYELGGDYQAGCSHAVPYLNAYIEKVPTPTNTTKWFLPSDEELKQLQKTVNTVNASLQKVCSVNPENAAVLLTTDATTTLNNTFYWSNTERNTDWIWANTLGTGGDASDPNTGSLTAQRNAKGYDGYFRMAVAF